MEIPNFNLPKKLIAQTPAKPRDRARMLVYDRSSGKIIDSTFSQLNDFLPENTTLVLNNSRVEKCRMIFGKMEIFVLDSVNNNTLRALVRPGRRFKKGVRVDLSKEISVEVIGVDSDGIRTLKFCPDLNSELYDVYRHTPFPPYIKASEKLSTEYQTVYSKYLGSKASPTAGLHFTHNLLNKIKKDHDIAEITLHVGLGTFASLKEENFKTMKLHREDFEINSTAAKIINNASDITAVGTTTLRCIESYSATQDIKEVFKASTEIFITPGYKFKRVDHLITNFHLPGTSLILLVGAFLGSDDILLDIYNHAIKNEYRFYSFGDGMLII